MNKILKMKEKYFYLDMEKKFMKKLLMQWMENLKIQ